MLAKSLEFWARKLGFEFCDSELGLQKKEIVELNEYRVLQFADKWKELEEEYFQINSYAIKKNAPH